MDLKLPITKVRELNNRKDKSKPQRVPKHTENMFDDIDDAAGPKYYPLVGLNCDPDSEFIDMEGSSCCKESANADIGALSSKILCPRKTEFSRRRKQIKMVNGNQQQQQQSSELLSKMLVNFERLVDRLKLREVHALEP